MLTRRVLVLALAAAVTLLAEVTPQRLEEQAAAYADLGKLNGAVVVARDGKPVLARGFGMANFEWNLPNTADTKFRLGSITKQFTGMAILMLEEQGKLSVDDPVSKLIPEAPEKWSAITIHHLLTHTSGIFNFTALPDYNKRKRDPLTPLEAMKLVSDRDLAFDPGTKFSYSNTGYIMLGLIIERASGMKYAEFVQKQIFEPLGMKDTGYDWNAAVVPSRASGYIQRPNGRVNADYIDMNVPHAAGALYSTVNDFIKWDAALREGKLLSKASYEKYLKPFKGDYAYGWSVKEKNGVIIQSHGGGIDGFATMFIRVPSQKLMVAVFSNSLPGDPGKVAQDLTQLAMGEDVKKPAKRASIKVPEEILRQYVGDYELAPNFVLTVSVENGQLMTQATNQPKLPVLAESETVFYPTVVDATITFKKDESGKVTSLVLDQGGRQMPARKR